MVRFKLGLKGFGYLFALFMVDLLIQSIWVMFSTKNSSVLVGIVTAVAMLSIGALIVIPLYKLLAKKNETFKLSKYSKNDFFFVGKWLLIMYILTMLANIICVLLFKHVSESTNQSMLEGFSKIHSMVPGLLVLTLLVGPILEELMFRGVLFNYFLQKLDYRFQIGFAGIMFGLFHIMGSSFQLTALIQYSIMGCVFGYVYYKTQKLQMSMLIHFMNNSIASIILIVQLFI